MGATSTIRIARVVALGAATLIGFGLSSPPARLYRDTPPRGGGEQRCRHR